MLDRLLESRSRRTLPVLPVSLAVGLHALIIFGVVELEADLAPLAAVAREVRPYETFVVPLPATVRAGGVERGRAGAALPAMPPMPLPPDFSVPGSVVNLVLPGPAAATGAPGPISLSDVLAPAAGVGVTTSADPGVEPPELIGSSLGRHVDEAKRLGLEGLVAIRCVIDSAGRVEPGSIEVLEGAPALVAAVRQGLLQARFRPGRLAGVAVRVQIVQRIRFIAGGIEP